MREGLGEVPERPPRAGIVFLGQQPEVVPQPEQLLEEAARLVGAAELDVQIDQPETPRP